MRGCWPPIAAIRYFEHGGQESEALSACKRYYALLVELVESFIKAHS
jgi:hypothetical protein